MGIRGWVSPRGWKVKDHKDLAYQHPSDLAYASATACLLPCLAIYMCPEMLCYPIFEICNQALHVNLNLRFIPYTLALLNGQPARGTRTIDAPVVQAGTTGVVPQHRSLRSREAAVDLRLAAVHQGGTLVALTRTATVGVAPQRDGRASGAHCGSCALALAHDHLGPEVEVCLRDLDRIEATLPRQVAVQLVSRRSRAIGVLALLAGDAELPVHVTAPIVETKASV